jgi:hypothetical protein
MAPPFPRDSIRDEYVKGYYTFGTHGAVALSWPTEKDNDGGDGYQANHGN